MSEVPSRRERRNRRRVWGVVAGVAVVTAACTSDGGEASTTQATQAPASTQATSGEQTPTIEKLPKDYKFNGTPPFSDAIYYLDSDSRLRALQSAVEKYGQRLVAACSQAPDSCDEYTAGSDAVMVSGSLHGISFRLIRAVAGQNGLESDLQVRLDDETRRVEDGPYAAAISVKSGSHVTSGDTAVSLVDTLNADGAPHSDGLNRSRFSTNFTYEDREDLRNRPGYFDEFEVSFARLAGDMGSVVAMPYEPTKVNATNIDNAAINAINGMLQGAGF